MACEKCYELRRQFELKHPNHNDANNQGDTILFFISGWSMTIIGLIGVLCLLLADPPITIKSDSNRVIMPCFCIAFGIFFAPATIIGSIFQFQEWLEKSRIKNCSCNRKQITETISQPQETHSKVYYYCRCGEEIPENRRIVFDTAQGFYKCSKCGFRSKVELSTSPPIVRIVETEPIHICQETPGIKCIICGSPMSDDSIVRCKSCRTQHHAECWTYNGGCAIYACHSTQFVQNKV